MGALITRSLSLPYLVRYRALDRKLRKILKNKYRYARSYCYVPVHLRQRSGLRLFVGAIALFEAPTSQARMSLALYDLLAAPTESILSQM